jgi:hypothetical protein
MIAALQETLANCVPLVPEVHRGWAAAVLRPDLRERLAGRLLEFHARGGPVERPEPHFFEEVTPPVGPVFDVFRPLLAEQDCDPRRWAETLAAVGIDGVLLLLGQRRTSASRTDAGGIPPPRETLLASAAGPCNPTRELTVAARAWTKHAPRSESSFWGTPSGGDADKNAAARGILETILDGATWWNVFGHYAHDTVFEARLPSGHGARWGNGGSVFIGFLEPFLKEERPA